MLLWFNLNNFNIPHLYISRGDGEHAGDFDHDAAGFADADDLAFDAFEGAFLDDDLLAFAELVADLREVDQVGVHGRGDGDEVFHGLVRDCEGAVCGTVPVVVDGAGVAEAADVGVEGFSCRLGEDQAGYGWDEALLLLAGRQVGLVPCHRDEGADAVLTKLVLNLQFSGVCGTKDKPALLGGLLALWTLR